MAINKNNYIYYHRNYNMAVITVFMKIIDNYLISIITVITINHHYYYYYYNDVNNAVS